MIHVCLSMKENAKRFSALGQYEEAELLLRSLKDACHGCSKTRECEIFNDSKQDFLEPVVFVTVIATPPERRQAGRTYAASANLAMAVGQEDGIKVVLVTENENLMISNGITKNSVELF
jgi:hypothetical protein